MCILAVAIIIIISSSSSSSTSSSNIEKHFPNGIGSTPEHLMFYENENCDHICVGNAAWFNFSKLKGTILEEVEKYLSK